MKMKGNWMQRIFLGTVVTILVIIPLQVKAEDTVRIGMLESFTGPVALEGGRVWMGFSIAADMVNAKGGLWGKKIEFVKGDSSSPDSAVSEMERLITVEKINVIAGGFSSTRVLPASEISERYKKVYWVPIAVADNITTRGLKYIFRYNVYSSMLGRLKVEFTRDKIASAMGKKIEDLRIATIHEDSLWGTSMSKVEAQEASKMGLKVVAQESYSNKAVDLSSLIMKLRAVKPDVIMMTGYFNDTVLFWKQCKELDFNFAALVESGAAVTTPEWLKTFGKEVNGTVGMGHLPANPNILSPKGREVQKEFLKRLAEKFNITQAGDSHLLSFEAGYILLTEVLPLAGSLDPEKVREAVLKINRDWKDSVNGMGVRFAPPGHPMAGQNLDATSFLHQWQNEKLVTLFPDNIAFGKPQVPMPTWDMRRQMK